jgi:hypothetical protein
MIHPMIFSAKPNTDRPIQLANAFAVSIRLVMTIVIHLGFKIKKKSKESYLEI